MIISFVLVSFVLMCVGGAQKHHRFQRFLPPGSCSCGRRNGPIREIFVYVHHGLVTDNSGWVSGQGLFESDSKACPPGGEPFCLPADLLHRSIIKLPVSLPTNPYPLSFTYLGPRVVRRQEETDPFSKGNVPIYKQNRTTMATGWHAAAYGALNTLSAVAIVMVSFTKTTQRTFRLRLNFTFLQANKVVLSVFKFSFPVCLTWFHSIFTAVGMVAMAAAGIYTPKHLPQKAVAVVSFCYVGFIVFNNLSIKVLRSSAAQAQCI